MTNPGSWQRLRVDDGSMLPMADPAGRILMGVTIAVLAGMVFGVPSLERLLPWMSFSVLFGVGMTVSGVAQVMRNRRFRSSIARAELEWPEICVDAEHAHANGESLVRMLRRRGYREYFVRRWLVPRLAENG